MTVTEQDGRTWARLAAPLFATRALGQGLEFVGWVVLARRLGTAAFGVASLAFLVARYGGLLADWGASVSGPRDVARDDEHRTRTRALVRHRALLTALLAAAFVAGCLAIGRAELIPMASVIAMLGLSRDWIAVGDHRGARAAAPIVVQGGVLLAVAAAFASPSQPAIAVGFGYAASATASILLNRLPRGGPRGGERIHRDPWMLTAVLMNQVLSSADTLVLGALGSAVAAGIYSAVYRLPNGWLAAVSILAGALLPITTRASGDHARSTRLRANAFRVSLGAAAVLLALTPAIYALIPRLFGEDFASGRNPVIVLLIATAVATAAAPLHQFYLASGTDRGYAGYLFCSALTIVVGSVALVPSHSMMGAAIATLAAHVVLAATLLNATIRMRSSDPPPPGPEA